MKGVLTDIISIYELLKQVAVSCDQNYASISFIPKNTGVVNPTLDQLDQSFMYSYILKEIILTINFDQTHINEFLAYSREQLAGNTHGLQNIDRLEKEYCSHDPIWWYTYEYLLHSMINRALRTMEVGTIIKMGFFLRDLHQQIVELHSEQFAGHNHSNSFKVFRGQGLSQTDFDKLTKTEGGLLSFNCFLSTSSDREISFGFAESIQSGSDLIGVLFQITVDPSIASTPFANISNFSHYQTEDEILVSMHSVFRIGQTKQIEENNRFWEVNLTLTSDNDSELFTLTEHIREETYPAEKGWHRLATLLLKLDQYDKAKKVCELLLNQELNAHDEEFIYHMLGWANNGQGNYLQALMFYEKALLIREKALSPNFIDLGNSYNDIGAVYFHMGDYSKALPYYENGLKIRQKYLHQNHPHIAHSFNNIASLYKTIGEYSKVFALSEKSLEIHQKSRSPNHPTLVGLYNNMGSVLKLMGEYTKALSLTATSVLFTAKCSTTPKPFRIWKKHVKFIEMLFFQIIFI